MVVQFVKYNERFLEKSYTWLSDPNIKYLTQSPKIDKFSQKKWFDSLEKRKDYIIYGIKADGLPIGAVGLKHIDYNTGEYWGYIGEKSFQGHGIGKLMIDKIINTAREKNINKLYLYVIHDNTQAIGLYKSKGFKVVEDDNKMIRMELEL